MNGASPAVRFLGPPPGELRRRLYRALARELLASPEPAAVVIETSTADRRSDVTVCPAGLLGTLGVTPVFRGALTWRSPGAPAPPADPEHLAVGWVARPLRPKRTPPVPAGPWDRPSAAGLLGPGGVLELQTFWATGRTDGQLWAARRARYRAPSLPDLPGRQASTGRFVAAEWSTACGLLCEAAGQATTDPAWSLASTASIPRDAWVAVPASAADRTAEPTWPDEPAIGPRADGHTVVLGATGSGKTTFLAERAARAIAGGTAVLAIDLHGDLSPGIMARLTPAERTAVVAVDASERPVVGVAALRGGDDRAAAQLVAAVKRLSPDGEELYWGFRLERIFDSFVRLVQESGGTLVDLYRLLTDADRREAVRLSTRSAELARFLDDLAPIVRRNPEFLWGAASRRSTAACPSRSCCAPGGRSSSASRSRRSGPRQRRSPARSSSPAATSASPAAAHAAPHGRWRSSWTRSRGSRHASSPRCSPRVGSSACGSWSRASSPSASRPSFASRRPGSPGRSSPSASPRRALRGSGRGSG